MKFVFAPDSFKESLSALKIAQILDDAAKRHFDGVTTALAPIADGGEGTVDALVTAANGIFREASVMAPLGNKIDARYGLIDEGTTAVLELAQASGLPLVPFDERDPLKTSSFGTGQLLRAAWECNVQRICIGIGGSATNDGGMGLLAALGVKFLDAAGRELLPCGAALESVARIDFDGLIAPAKDACIQVICDVTNPLLGSNGATNIYGPQKGATRDMLIRLEAGMENYARRMHEALGRDIADIPGAGAAGGVGAALCGALGATITAGIDAVLDAIHFDELIADAALVVTGEGKIDSQSIAYGKAPVGVAKRCAARGIPVLVLAGGIGPGAQGLYDIATASMQTIVNGPMALEHAMQNAESLARDGADRLFRTLKIGMRLHENN